MPRVNIYIRGEDWVKWQAIESKPDWLHAHLDKVRIAYRPTAVENWRKTKVIKHVLKPVMKDDGLCEHYQPKGNCSHKDAKKSGCNK